MRETAYYTCFSTCLVYMHRPTYSAHGNNQNTEANNNKEFNLHLTISYILLQFHALAHQYMLIFLLSVVDISVLDIIFAFVCSVWNQTHGFWDVN